MKVDGYSDEPELTISLRRKTRKNEDRAALEWLASIEAGGRTIVHGYGKNAMLAMDDAWSTLITRSLNEAREKSAEGKPEKT